MKKNKLFNYFRIMVPFYIPIAIAGAFVGITGSGGIFDLNILLAFLSLGLLVGAFNTFNGIADYRIDRINKPYRPIPSGKISRKTAFFYAIILYALSLLIASQLTTEFFIIMLLSTIITLFYSLPFVRLKKRFIWSNISGAIFYGLLCPLAGWSLIPTNPIPIFLIGFIFLLTFSLSVTKDFEDIRGDRAFSIKTFPIKLGLKGSVLITSLSLIISFAYITFLIALKILEAKFAIVLLTVPAFLYLIQKMYAKPKSVYNSIGESIGARKIFFMLIGLGIVVEILIGIIALV